jgi:hypothetical protein
VSLQPQQLRPDRLGRERRAAPLEDRRLPEAPVQFVDLAGRAGVDPIQDRRPQRPQRRVARHHAGPDAAHADARERVAGLRRELASARAYERVAIPPQLAAIAACESGGDPTAIGGGGLYRGKYQFDFQTWASVGGTGDPAAAPEAEQDMRAAMLYERAGAAPWPVCGS